MFFKGGVYTEVNPLLGPSPSRAALIGFGVVGRGIFYAVAVTFPDPWRQIALDSIIKTERLNIEENRTVYQGWNTEYRSLRGRSMNGNPILITFRF